LRSPKDVQGMYADYKNDISQGYHYEGMSPKITAIHECTHVLDALLTATENGAFKNKALMKVSTSPGISHYFGGYAHRIIEQAYIDVFEKDMVKKFMMELNILVSMHCQIILKCLHSAYLMNTVGKLINSVQGLKNCLMKK